jgi:hypothetical protein
MATVEMIPGVKSTAVVVLRPVALSGVADEVGVTACVSRQRSCGLDRDQRRPGGASRAGDVAGSRDFGWMSMILPKIEQAVLLQQAKRWPHEIDKPFLGFLSREVCLPG